MLTSNLRLFRFTSLSGGFYLFFQYARVRNWVISLGKVCREAGLWRAAVKRLNWAFNHADILTALNLSRECALESVRAAIWLDHQDATPDRSKAERNKAGKWMLVGGNQSVGAARSSMGTPVLILGALTDIGAANGVVSAALGWGTIAFSRCVFI